MSGRAGRSGGTSSPGFPAALPRGAASARADACVPGPSSRASFRGSPPGSSSGPPPAGGSAAGRRRRRSTRGRAWSGRRRERRGRGNPRPRGRRVVGLGRPERFALGAAIGTPARRTRSRAIPVRHPDGDGREARRDERRERSAASGGRCVRGPGQNRRMSVGGRPAGPVFATLPEHPQVASRGR